MICISVWAETLSKTVHHFRYYPDIFSHTNVLFIFVYKFVQLLYVSGLRSMTRSNIL